MENIYKNQGDASSGKSTQWIILLLWVGLWLPCLGLAQSAYLELPEGSLPMLNKIQYGDSAAVRRWNAYRQQAEQQGMPLQILHIGDSHIQSGALALVARKQLQQVFGMGGLGLTFPYAGARTYSPRGYKTRVSGSFEFAKSFTLPPKLPMGLMGATIKTKDVRAKLRFLDLPAPPVNANYVVEVWADGSDSMFQLQILQAGVAQPMEWVTSSPFYSQLIQAETPALLSDSSTDGVALVNRELPLAPMIFEDWKVYRAVVAATDSVVIQFKQAQPQQNQIEIYGVNIYLQGQGTTDTGKNIFPPAGLVYHAAGMGGARFESLLYESLLPQQLQYLNPSLVLLDFGTNDVAPLQNFPEKLQEQIELSVDIIQQALPHALVVLASPMDMEFRGKKVVHTYPLSAMMKEIAMEKGCLLWDFYWIAGAKGSLPRWQSSKKVSSDGIHMTEPGYWLKGNLLTTALLEFFSSATSGDLAPSRWLNEDSVWLVWNGILNPKHRGKSPLAVNPAGKVNLSVPQKEVTPQAVSIKAVPPTAVAPKAVVPKAVPPKVVSPQAVPQSSVSKNKTSPFLNPQAAIANPNTVGLPKGTPPKARVVEKKVRHTVKPGEDIFDIAFEFGVTVAQIKQWNGLKSNNLQAGKVIVIIKSAPIGSRR